MNVGKTLFAQVMEFVPRKTFARIIERNKGVVGVRALGCGDLFRIMAISQLTWRESLRDIEVCLEADQSKLFHMGIATPPARSTLADALNLRDWRIYHALAPRPIAHARVLYAQDASVLGIDASVYALDSTTIDLCLSLFDSAPFRSTKAAIKLHTLLDLRGAIQAFIQFDDGKLHDVNVLDILVAEAGCFYIMDRGYVDYKQLYAVHQAGVFFVTRSKEGMDARRVYSYPVDRVTGPICDQRVMLNGFYSAKNYREHFHRIRFEDPESGKAVVFPTNNTTLPALAIAALYRSRWQVELFFKWIQQQLRIKRFLATNENAVRSQIWCAVATRRCASRQLEDTDHPGRHEHARLDRHYDHRGSYRRIHLPRLSGTGTIPGTAARRCGGDGQPQRAQGQRSAPTDIEAAGAELL